MFIFLHKKIVFILLIFIINMLFLYHFFSCIFEIMMLVY
mgnify:CR=1 FL=1